jgi:hypothetical protein
MLSIRIPVACPDCRAESLQHFDLNHLQECLRRGAPIQLRAICHARTWSASPLELRLLQEYLREMCEGGELRPIYRPQTPIRSLEMAGSEASWGAEAVRTEKAVP